MGGKHTPNVWERQYVTTVPQPFPLAILLVPRYEQYRGSFNAIKVRLSRQERLLVAGRSPVDEGRPSARFAAQIAALCKPTTSPAEEEGA